MMTLKDLLKQHKNEYICIKYRYFFNIEIATGEDFLKDKEYKKMLKHHLNEEVEPNYDVNKKCYDLEVML